MHCLTRRSIIERSPLAHCNILIIRSRKDQGQRRPRHVDNNTPHPPHPPPFFEFDLFPFIDMCWTFLLCFRDMYPQCYCAGRGAHRSPVMDVLVIIQLMFLQYFEDVEVPQIPVLDRVLQIPVVLLSRVRTEQTVQAPEIPQRSSGLVVHAPVVMLRQLLGVGQCRKLWKFHSCCWCSSWCFLTRPLSL